MSEHNIVLKPAVSMLGRETRKWASRAWVGTVSYGSHSAMAHMAAQHCVPCGRLGSAPFAPNESVAAEALCDDTGTDTRNFSAPSSVTFTAAQICRTQVNRV